MDREKILTVTIKDCEVQTFRSGGKGGQHQNTSDSGVRIIHPPSGARGESRTERSQLVNKRAAFRRMAESQLFRLWVQKEHQRILGLEAIAETSSEQRIRTYNLIERRVTDHRPPITVYNIDEVLDGKLGEIYTALLREG